MEKNKGWISLHRKFLDWEWYDDANTMRLFIHLLLCANHQNNKWRGVLIQRGQLISSQPKLANSLKLSIMQIRNSLNKLKSTGEITVYSTADYSIITVKNYNSYQEDNRLENSLTSDKEQSSNRLTTTNNNDNNSTINTSICINSSSKENFDKFFDNLTEEEEEILKKYSKKEKVKYFRPWLRKIFNNGDYEGMRLRAYEYKQQLDDARQLIEAQKAKEAKEIQEPELTEEEKKAFMQKMRAKVGITGNKRRSKK